MSQECILQCGNGINMKKYVVEQFLPLDFIAMYTHINGLKTKTIYVMFSAAVVLWLVPIVACHSSRWSGEPAGGEAG